MQTLKFVHWQDGDAFLGYLLDYPDYWTQGDTLDDLKHHLADLYRDLTGDSVPIALQPSEQPPFDESWREGHPPPVCGTARGRRRPDPVGRGKAAGSGKGW
jgi:hypothetical protein